MSDSLQLSPTSGLGRFGLNRQLGHAEEGKAVCVCVWLEAMFKQSF